MPRADGCRGAEQFTEGRLRVQRLEPDLADAVAHVIGEKTHAVGAGHQLREIRQRPFPRQVFQHTLAHAVARPDGKLEAGDDAKGAQAHHAAQEFLAVRAGQRYLIAGGPDQINALHRSGQ